jgi:hypothetical protein
LPLYPASAKNKQNDIPIDNKARDEGGLVKEDYIEVTIKKMGLLKTFFEKQGPPLAPPVPRGGRGAV